jgi:hypothetical protein
MTPKLRALWRRWPPTRNYSRSSNVMEWTIVLITASLLCWSRPLRLTEGLALSGLPPHLLSRSYMQCMPPGLASMRPRPRAPNSLWQTLLHARSFLPHSCLAGRTGRNTALSAMSWPTNSHSVMIFIPSLLTNVSPCLTVGSITYPVPLVALPDLLLVNNPRPRRMKRSSLPKTQHLHNLSLVSPKVKRHLKPPRLLVRSPVVPKFG